MIYFVAKKSLHARHAAVALRIHPTAWKYAADVERLRGLTKVLFIVLDDTFRGPISAGDVGMREIGEHMTYLKTLHPKTIQIVHITLDGIVG